MSAYGRKLGWRRWEQYSSRKLQAGRQAWKELIILQLMHAERPVDVWQQPKRQGPCFKYCVRNKTVG